MKTYSPIHGMHVCADDTGGYVEKVDYDAAEAEIERWRDSNNRLREEMERQAQRAEKAEAELANLNAYLTALEDQLDSVGLAIARKQAAKEDAP